MDLEGLSRARLVTDISTFSNQTAYGITWFARGGSTQKTKEYLETGAKFCTILIEGFNAALAEKISFSQLKYLDIVRPLKESGVNLRKLLVGVEKTLAILNSLSAGKKYSQADINFAVNFFHNLSAISLKISFRILYPAGIGGCGLA